MRKIAFPTLILSLVLAAAASVSAQHIVFDTLDGDKIDVEAQKNKVVIMGIGASWLPLSNDQADTINKLAKRYQGRDVIFYFIATDSSSTKSKNFASNDDIRKFVNRNKLNVTILRDDDGKTSIQKYKLDQLPAFIILDKNGRPDGDPISGIDPLQEIDTSEILSKRIDRLL